MKITLRQILACALCVFFVFANAYANAADVEFSFSPRETWIGSPSILKIIVRDGDVIGEPVLPKVAGLDFEIQPGRQTMNSMQIINGKTTRSNTTTITIMITPSVAGVINIPPISIVVDGVKHSIEPTSISSSVSTTGDLLSAQVIGNSKRSWIGQPLDVTLRILVKPFQSPEHRVTLGEADMWQFIDQDRSEFGPFMKTLREMMQNRQRPVGNEQLIDGKAYLVYEIPAQIIPSTSGIPDFSEIRIAWNYPTRISSTRDFFGRNELSVGATKPISASASAVNIDVLPLPTEGQPKSFQGAVGSFTIDASAKPSSVSVGDPITLTLTMTDRSGTRNLETVQPPKLDIPSIQSDFRMPTAPLAGSVKGNTKTFTQTLRPTRAGVDKIPPIEFSWFDTVAGEYRSASTMPIDIKVVASERIATDAILGTSAGASTPAKQLTAAEGGLTANVAPTLAMVRDQSRSIGFLAGTAMFLTPPIACAAILLLRRRSDRYAGDVAFAKEQGARGAANKRLAVGDGATALVGYIADRINQPSGTVTRAEARSLMTAANASNELLERVDRLLAQFERARFSAGNDSGASAQSVTEAKSCIQGLEKLDWRKARALHMEKQS